MIIRWLRRKLMFWALLAAGAAVFLHRPDPAPMPAIPPLVGPVDRIVVEKAARRMVVYRGDLALREYRVALGFAPNGAKVRQGDGKTPEGVFHIDRVNAQSSYHLSVGLDYPQAADRARAATGGYDAGGDIFIHGQPNGLPDDSLLKTDWTAGCIAVSNAEIREIFAAVSIGAVVEVRP
jgi:murein L,D-transpeptidase YafK